MNKKIIIGAIALLLLAGGAYAMQSKKTSPSTSKSQSDGQLTSEATEFAKAIESGKPTICTMTKGSDLMEYSIKGKKMRIKTTNTMADEKGISKTTVAHMVSDEKYFYTWEDSSKRGSKMSIVIPSSAPSASIIPIENAPKFDSQADYDNLKNEGYTINCKTSIIDDSVFTPPSDVKFIDPSEFMRQIPSPAANGQIDMKQLEELQRQYDGE